MKYFLGADIGTTAIKAVLFEPSGKIVGTGTVEYKLETPEADIVELDVEVYYTSFLKAIEIALAGRSQNCIAAFSITGQAETLICIDADGKPLRKAIVWLDNRAKEEAIEFQEQFGEDYLCRISGQTAMLPCYPAPKLRYLSKHEPEVVEKTAKFMMVEDYLLYRLTGTISTCRGLMPSSMYYNIESGEYVPELIAFANIRPDQLPPLAHPGQAVGHWNQAIAASAPIDHVCGLLGAGGGNGVVTAATGCAFAACAALPKLEYDPEKRIGTYHGFTPNSHVLLPWTPTAGMVLKYFRDEFSGNLSYEQLDQLAKTVPPGSENLILLPHLSGAVSPVCNPAARGTAWGITMAHTRGHFARAIMESVAYLLKDNFDALRQLGASVSEIRLLGGAARSPIWRQIQSDVLGLPVSTLKSPEAVAMGAAILGAVAAGEFPDAATGAATWVQLDEQIEPSKDAPLYAEFFQTYQKLNALILPTWKL